MSRTATIKFTEAELWELVNAIPQAGSDPSEALKSADEKISYAYWRLSVHRHNPFCSYQKGQRCDFDCARDFNPTERRQG